MNIGLIFLILLLFFGLLYFLMWRPMRQREKTHDTMLADLKRGEKVITAGGLYGVVESIDEESVVLKVESGTLIRVTKGGIIKRQEN